jgi:hypothetical protein
MNFKHNPPRRIALIWAVTTVIGLFIIFLPGLLKMDSFNGGFALSFLGGFIVVLGLIALVTYWQTASILDRITKKENVLANWHYDPAEWQQYTGEEQKEDAADKRHLFFLIAVIAVAVGLVFGLLVWLKERGNPVVVLGIVVAIIVITGLAVWAYGQVTYRRDKNRLGEVYIALDGVYLNRQLHIWKGLGNHLKNILYEDHSPDRSRISIVYSSPSREGPEEYALSIPVPSGQEETAKNLVRQITQTHLSRP